MSASYLPYPQWLKPLLNAVMEMKPEILILKLKVAETAISDRLRDVENRPGWKNERLALYDAVARLTDLKKVLLESTSLED